ncbi:MAG: Uma2 family endonuclease [Minicystis sp.]
MQSRIEATCRYVYPDGAALCDKPLVEDDHRDTLLNPTLVVEVLSDSTEAYDRGDKLAHYRSIPSVMEYVLASQKEPRLEVFTKQPNGSWMLRTHGPGEQATLVSLDCTLDVDRIYQGALG